MSTYAEARPLVSDERHRYQPEVQARVAGRTEIGSLAGLPPAVAHDGDNLMGADSPAIAFEHERRLFALPPASLRQQVAHQ
jgi:hypothetical protein